MTDALDGKWLDETNECIKRQRDQLAAEVKRLRDWINDLDELARYKGDSGHREWHGDMGWLHKGQVVYLGEEKP